MKKNPSEKNGQSGGASRWRVCYQRGLPRLVYVYLKSFTDVKGCPYMSYNHKVKGYLFTKVPGTPKLSRPVWSKVFNK